MEIKTHSHNFAMQIINQTPEFSVLWNELFEAIQSISDADLEEHYKSKHEGRSMSLSQTINALLRERLHPKGWVKESPIFGDGDYDSSRWRLDFAKFTRIADSSLDANGPGRDSGIAVEVAFNHAEAIAWNLLKPVLSSELNHVKKAIQTEIGVIICATEELKHAGAFDSVVGTFDQFVNVLRPLSNVLTVPILIVGLREPETFKISKRKEGTKNRGFIESL